MQTVILNGLEVLLRDVTRLVRCASILYPLLIAVFALLAMLSRSPWTAAATHGRLTLSSTQVDFLSIIPLRSSASMSVLGLCLGWSTFFTMPP